MFQNVRQVILKVTRGCNLACKYCYVFDKPDYNNEEMSDEVFDFIMRRWLQETTKDPRNPEAGSHQPLELIFHGGEPLRIGKQKMSRFLKKAYQYAKEYDKKLTCGLQTNGTLLDKDWYEIFYNYNTSIGLSFDGLGQSSDLRGLTSTEVFLKIIEAQQYGLGVGPLMVLHKGNYKTLTKNYNMLQQIGVKSIKINRGVDLVSEAGKSEYELTSQELADASKETLHYMFMQKGRFEESVLVNIMRRFMNSREDDYHSVPTSREDHCYSRYCGGMKTLLEIEPDGTFQFCGRTAKRSTATVGGSIFDKDVLELGLSRQQWEFQKGRLTSLDKNRCNECPAQHICDGGCIAFSHQKLGEAKVDSVTCGYFKRLHEILLENQREVATFIADKRSSSSEQNQQDCTCKDGKNRKSPDHRDFYKNDESENKVAQIMQPNHKNSYNPQQ